MVNAERVSSIFGLPELYCRSRDKTICRQVGIPQDEFVKAMKRIKETIGKAVFLLGCNPRLFFKKLAGKIDSFRPLPKSPVEKIINEIRFGFDFGCDPRIKEMYYGAYEVEIVEAMKKILKKGETFIDVGANIGYLSAVGLGLVGKTGEVHSFEPVPEYFDRLRNLAMSNPEYKMIVNRCALGDKPGTAIIAVTGLSNIGWNTMVPGYMSNETIRGTVEVPVCRLDRYIKERALSRITLIKIDTEGFEFPVLKGLGDYFENVSCRPAIICEIAPAAYPLLGCRLAQLSEYMKKYNYHAFSLINSKVEIDITKLEKTTDVLFL